MAASTSRAISSTQCATTPSLHALRNTPMKEAGITERLSRSVHWFRARRFLHSALGTASPTEPRVSRRGSFCDWSRLIRGRATTKPVELTLWELADLCSLPDCYEGTRLSTVSFLVGEPIACCSGNRSVTPLKRYIARAPLMAAFATPAAAQSVAVAPAPLLVPMTAEGFRAMALQSDAFEIASSHLALQQSRNPAIRSFARQMVQDHSMTSQALGVPAGSAV